VQYDSSGHTTTVNPQDLGATSSFQVQLTAALNAFNQGSPDLATAAASLSTASTAANAVSASVNTDATNLTNALSSVSTPFNKWAGTYNSGQIFLGAQSLSDAGTRLTKINQIVNAIQATAQLVDQNGPTAALSQQFSDLITQLGSQINTTNQSGLDNIFAGSSTFSYNVIGNYDIQIQGQDLVGNVLNQLNGLDVSSVANADQVVAAVNSATVKNALKSAGNTIGVDSQYFATASTIDPQSTIFKQYAALAAQVPTLVTNAASGTTNLLDVHQTQSITITANSAGQVITVTPESTFDSGVTQTLATGNTELLSNPTTAFSTLNTARFNANQILGHINTELGQLQYATGLTNAAIKNLQSQQAKTASQQQGLPVKATAYAVQFVKKYLAAVDAQAAASGTGVGGNAFLVQLFQPVQSSGSTTLPSIDLGSALGANVNLFA